MKIEEFIAEQLDRENISIETLELVEKKQADEDRFGNRYYERDRLLHIFKGRLRGCKKNDPNNEAVEWLKQEIAKFESLKPTETIFYWEANTEKGTISGRSTKDQLLHIYPERNITSD